MAKYLRACAATALLLIPMIEAAAAGCSRGPKTIHWDGDTETLYSSEDQWTEVVFPEELMGKLEEKPNGIEIRAVPIGADVKDNPLKDRVYVQVQNDTYAGGVYFHGKSGHSFHLRVLARPDCANTKVTVLDARVDDSRSSGKSKNRSRGSGRMGLIEHLHLGRLPDGFHRQTIEKPKKQRLVFEQGPVAWFLEEIWRGPERTGFILSVVNRDRVPYEVSLQQIDFSHPKIRETFGLVREVAMDPFDRKLGPAPEFAVDELHPENRGLIYIMARRDRGDPDG